MTPCVLVCVALAAADGRPGPPAATAPAMAGLGGEWVGTWDNGNGTPPLRVRLKGEVFRFSCDGITIRVAAQPVPGGSADGVVRAVVADGGGTIAVWGICKAEPGRLLICVAYGGAGPPATFRPVPNRTALISLRPAALRKPESAAACGRSAGATC